MELLLAGGMREFEEDQVLRLAENVKFFRVCELVYRKQRKFAKVLTSIIKDASRHDQVRPLSIGACLRLLENCCFQCARARCLLFFYFSAPT